MIYKQPPVPLKEELGANKLFGNSSCVGLKLMFVRPAMIILSGPCCVTHLNFLNFVQTLNFKFLFSYSGVLHTPL